MIGIRRLSTGSSRTFRLLGISLFLLAAGLFAAGLTARADSYGTDMSLSPTQGIAGQPIEVKGQGFIPTTTFTTTFCSHACYLMPSEGQVDCEPSSADSTGAIDCKFTILPAFEAGKYTLTVTQTTGANGEGACSTAGENPSPVPVPGLPGQPTPSLPVTLPGTIFTGGELNVCQVSAARTFTLLATSVSSGSAPTVVAPLPPPSEAAAPVEPLPSIPAAVSAPPTSPQTPTTITSTPPRYQLELLAARPVLVPGLVVFLIGGALLALSALPAMEASADQAAPAEAGLLGFVRRHRRPRTNILDDPEQLAGRVKAALGNLLSRD